MTENTIVKFIKPIVKSDFPEVGMKATLISSTFDEENKGYKIVFDFSPFLKENTPLFTKRFEKKFSTKKLTALESGDYGDVYSVFLSATEETIDSVLGEYVEVL